MPKHPPPPPDVSRGRWFEALADWMGPAYLRYSFTRGTRREVDGIVRWADLRPGHRVLDVGCGPGRHAHELARRGIRVTGVDISARFCSLAAAGAPPGAGFVRADARWLPVAPGSCDAAISICQGGFGLLRPTAEEPDGDLSVLAGMARSVRPGGTVVLTAFSAPFAVAHQVPGGDVMAFDVTTGTVRERTTVRDPRGRERPAELWTTCFTPRELRLAASAVGLEPVAVLGAGGRRWAEAPPTLDDPELVLVARRP